MKQLTSNDKSELESTTRSIEDIRKEKAQRTHQLRSMNRHIRLTDFGIQWKYLPYMVSACCFCIAVIYNLPPFSWITTESSIGVMGIMCLSMLSWVGFTYWITQFGILRHFCKKTNADYFLAEVRAYSPLNHSAFNGLEESIKKNDYEGEWIRFARKALADEIQAISNL